MEWERVVKQMEDNLFPRLHLTIRQRALYHYLVRHTRLVGADSRVFPLGSVARALAISDSTAREDLRDLQKKGCIQIEERSRTGHLIRVLLPGEIEGIVVEATPPEILDVESLDFYTDRRFVDALLARENGQCFYCFHTLKKETCHLDHVTPQLAAGSNSYKNIVAACPECNSNKQGVEGPDFVRALYRRGDLSHTELENRLGAIEELRAGHLIPPLQTT
jgi:hypothetical protein